MEPFPKRIKKDSVKGEGSSISSKWVTYEHIIHTNISNYLGACIRFNKFRIGNKEIEQRTGDVSDTFV